MIANYFPKIKTAIFQSVQNAKVTNEDHHQTAAKLQQKLHVLTS